MAASDFGATVLVEPLRRKLALNAPGVRLDFVNLADFTGGIAQILLRHDVFVCPRGLGLGGVFEHCPLFSDRLVCVVDQDNPRLRDGRLDFAALEDLPHAVLAFRSGVTTMIDRLMEENGVQRRVSLTATGFLPLVLAVAGSDAVTVLPERLARRFTADPRLAIADLPFPTGEMQECAWWAPARAADAGHRWFLNQLGDLARELDVDPIGRVATG
ncbi:LysR substrate-binding domain-containing protein [Nocardia sp. NPDC051911]|uniref:LysR substrate-binding domain-containing protein n=1 Tax=Nocardia sp. NPDC051911 TaxID=3154648 RepID=UPI003429327D